MLKKKSSSVEKKRKSSQSEERRGSGKRRSTESVLEDSKDVLTDPDLDRIGSDIEEGGLDLSMPFQPITAYVTDKKEMLKQCFHVLGEKKLQKMLPDELKDCSLEEIKSLCWEQLEPIAESSISQILAGEELTSVNSSGNTKQTPESQQDNNVDSTSCLREPAKTEDLKHEGVSGEESDVLSINADTYDSDIEGLKEEQNVKPEDVTQKGGQSSCILTDPVVKPTQEAVTEPQPVGVKKDIQNDIDKSVCEILAISLSSIKDETEERCTPLHPPSISLQVKAGPISSHTQTVCQPSIQQLELLELEMRARAIKALMKAGDGKQNKAAKNM